MKNNFDDEQGHITYLLETVNELKKSYNEERLSVLEKHYEIGGIIQVRDKEWGETSIEREKKEYEEKLKYSPRERAIIARTFLWGKMCMCDSMISYLNYCQMKITVKGLRKQIKIKSGN